MIHILICEDDREVLNSVEKLESDTVKVHSVTTVRDLEEMSGNGILYNFIVLDGHVTDGVTTRYLQLIRRGAFQHLKDTHFLLIGSNANITRYQSTVLSEEVLRAHPDSPLYTDEIADWLEGNPAATENDLYRAFPSLDRKVWLLHNSFKPKWKHTIVTNKSRLSAFLRKMLRAR